MRKNVKNILGKEYEIDINHYRYICGPVDGWKLVLSGAVQKSNRRLFSCRGGKTVVNLIDQDGVMLTKEAVCSRDENFNRRLGVRIALGRAIKELKRNTAQTV